MALEQENQLDQSKFSQGMTTQQYIDQIKVNKDPFVEIYESVNIPKDSLNIFAELKEPLNLGLFKRGTRSARLARKWAWSMSTCAK